MHKFLTLTTSSPFSTLARPRLPFELLSIRLFPRVSSSRVQSRSSNAYLLKVIVEEGKDSRVVADSDLMRHRELLQFWQICRFDSAKNILAQIMRLQLKI
jgi:hypothetical protein